MADEVIISERSSPSPLQSGQTTSADYGQRVTTQVLDAGVKSAAFNAQTKAILITANGADLWYKIGDTNVSAVANTDGNEFLPADQSRLEVVKAGQFIDTAADA